MKFKVNQIKKNEKLTRSIHRHFLERKKKKKERRKESIQIIQLNHSEQSNLFEIRYYLGFRRLASFRPNNLLNIRAQHQLKAASRNSPLIHLPACLIIVLAKGGPWPKMSLGMRKNREGKKYGPRSDYFLTLINCLLPELITFRDEVDWFSRELEGNFHTFNDISSWFIDLIQKMDLLFSCTLKERCSELFRNILNCSFFSYLHVYFC